ncbi:MAG: type III pantothenate kinase [Candidatus Thiodiazotropha sp. (ex Dulcina madagascariensis)]|nr:type III pantothenate kinase [Candidatus Thiodiazotropha sp. (ex Dulcina madagascariensis)]
MGGWRSMKLFVDIGNTAIKWATGEELERGVLHRAAANDLPGAIEEAWTAMPKPREVHLACVRQPQAMTGLIEWVRRHWQTSPRLAQTKQQEQGVTNGYGNVSQLGVDRWLALLGARAISPNPVIVVDCGSATTIDAMDGKGRHLGGVILPGLRLFAGCLRQRTDMPPYGEGRISSDCFATDTATGIATGAMLAHTSTIREMYHRLQQRSNGEADCLLTGGDAGMLAGHLELAHELRPDLVLQGLALQSDQAE